MEKGGSVLKSILKMSGYIVCVAWSGMVCATGLGGINVSSNLGQPLKAEIELVSVDKADKSSISARLASADAFKNAGIDYPYGLPKIKFEVVNRDSGEPYVKVTSVQAINEPFVTLLVEVTWSSGKLLREYTFLLDPADYKVQQPKAAAVKPIEPVVLTPAVPVAPVVPAEPLASEAIVAPEVPLAPAASEPVPIAQEPAPQEPSSEQPAASALVEEKIAVPAEELPPAVEQEAAPLASDEPSVAADALSEEEAVAGTDAEEDPFTVVPGDTLSEIALTVKPEGVSLERMLVAMYRANTDLFVGKNMNRLKTGKIIRIPDATELEAVQQSEAVKVVRAHVADWNAYRQQLAAIHTDTSDQAVRQESSGKVTAAVAEKATAGKEAPKEVLKLSKGEAPSDKIVGGGKSTAKDQANAQEEEAIAKSKALKESQERTALLEKNVKDLQRLADLKQPGAGEQANAASAAVAAGTAATSQVAAASAPKKMAVPAPVPVVVTEPALFDSILEDPIMLAGGVALLLALGGVGFVLARRKRNAGSGFTAEQAIAGQEEEGGATGRIAAPTMPSPETGDFTQAALDESPAQGGDDEVDPIGEADLFLTFGRDAQAEEVLKEALKTSPGHIPVKLKLLSIYANRKDTKSFFTYAREIKDSGDEAAWNQATAMGRELEPNNPLYGGSGNSAAPVAEHKAEAPTVDFDLGFGSSAAATPAPSFQNTVVVEASPHESTTVLSREKSSPAPMTMDFDVTGTNPGGMPSTRESGVAAAVNMDEMVFDVTTTHPAGGMPAPATAAAPAESALGDLVFDITADHPGMPAATAPATPAPVADEGLAFTLDFPSDFTTPAAPKPEKALDIGLGEISLNLDSLTSTGGPSSSETKDEHWQDVATKLDLAKAYQEMGDSAGAKEILDEVMRDGDEQQRASAQAMIQQL